WRSTRIRTAMPWSSRGGSRGPRPRKTCRGRVWTQPRPLVVLLLGLRLLVHTGTKEPAGGDAREQLVGLSLLVERRVQQLLPAVVAELVSQRAGGAVAGDLVVLDALGGGDQRRVEGVRVALGADDVVALLDQPLHAL